LLALTRSIRITLVELYASARRRVLLPQRIAIMLRAALLLLILCAPALARDNGQYDKVAPEIRQWFREQRSPKTGMICCSEADGSEAQEDIRDGHYWATWSAVSPNWYPVPDEVVIKDRPNKVGRPVVWTYYERGEVKIRCYAPGGKV
jgi:hypothetical protein